MKLQKYNMSHRFSTGFRTGKLFVSMFQDVTPGEVWYGRSTSLARLDPLNKPAFMSYNIERRKFFVPYRLIDENFVDYWTGKNPSYQIPTYDAGTGGSGLTEPLQMFGMGFNPTREEDLICAYPFRAYNLIWNKFFRPEGINEVDINTVHNAHTVSHSQKSYYGQMRDSVQLGDTVIIDDSPTLDATAIRDGLALQRLRENLKVFGDKYIDRLRAYGANVSHSLIDEPTPVSHGRGTVGISEVVETANTGSEGGYPGQAAGHGIVTFQDNLKPRKFHEPGILMEVCYSKIPLSLKYAKDRMFLKHLESEGNAFYNPEIAMTTDAIVHSDEIFHISSSNTNFAYTDNYEWLRSATDKTAGGMLYTDYADMTATKNLTNVPTLAFLQQVDDYDGLFQNGASQYRADVQMSTFHKLRKLSPVRKRRRV